MRAEFVCAMHSFLCNSIQFFKIIYIKTNITFHARDTENKKENNNNKMTEYSDIKCVASLVAEWIKWMRLYHDAYWKQHFPICYKWCRTDTCCTKSICQMNEIINLYWRLRKTVWQMPYRTKYEWKCAERSRPGRIEHTAIVVDSLDPAIRTVCKSKQNLMLIWTSAAYCTFLSHCCSIVHSIQRHTPVQYWMIIERNKM